MNVPVDMSGCGQQANSAVQVTPHYADFGNGPCMVIPAAGFCVSAGRTGGDESVILLMFHPAGRGALAWRMDNDCCLRIEQELRGLREQIEATATEQAAAALAKAGAK